MAAFSRREIFGFLGAIPAASVASPRWLSVESPSGLSTGIEGLDGMLRGLRGGRLYVVGGPTSSGKTMLALRIIEHVALQLHKRVLFFALDQSAGELKRLMACSMARVNPSDLAKNLLTPPDLAAVRKAADCVERASISIDDSSILTVEDPAIRARKDHPDLVVVDPMEMIEMNGIGKPEPGPARAFIALKELARELNVPVLALCRRTRRRKAREGDIGPLVSDLIATQTIEEQADAVMIMGRPSGDQPRELLPIWFRINRKGARGELWIPFNRLTLRFEWPGERICLGSGIIQSR